MLKLVSLAMALALSSNASAGLIINPTFDASITGNADSAVLQADVNRAISIYETLFDDPITVSILFRYAGTQPNGNPFGPGGLAQSNYIIYAAPYANFLGALAFDATTANDAIALANLPNPSLFPNNPQDMVFTSANGRALGANTPGFVDATGNISVNGTFDGIVSLNSNRPFQLDRTGGIASNKFDVEQSIEHEIDEVLGLGSILPFRTDFLGHSAVRPSDLFRYSAPNTLSLSPSSSASSYLSIDRGVTKLAPFSQSPNGDYGDYGPNPTSLVQFAFSSPGTQSDVSATSPEGVNLDVIGYDLVTPEPASFLLAFTGIGLVAACRRVRRI